MSPAFSTVSTDFRRVSAVDSPSTCARARSQSNVRTGQGIGTSLRSLVDHEVLVKLGGALTLWKPPAYNRRALPQNQRGASRRKCEKDLPAECPEACEDARLPCPHGHPRRPRDSRRPSSQGAQGPERVGAHPSAGVLDGRDRMSTIKSTREIDTIFRTATRVAHPAAHSAHCANTRRTRPIRPRRFYRGQEARRRRAAQPLQARAARGSSASRSPVARSRRRLHRAPEHGDRDSRRSLTRRFAASLRAPGSSR